MPTTIGMSIGWVVLPSNLVPKMSAIYAQTSPHPLNLNGRILEIMLRKGIYDEFLRQLFPKFESRRVEVCRLLSEHLSDYASWSTDRIVFWIKLDDNIDTLKLFRINKNLIILSGIIFDKKFEQYIFILPYAVSDNDLKASIEQLAGLIKRCIK